MIFNNNIKKNEQRTTKKIKPIHTNNQTTTDTLIVIDAADFLPEYKMKNLLNSFRSKPNEINNNGRERVKERRVSKNFWKFSRNYVQYEHTI